MARKHGDWTILSSQQKYQNETLTLCEDEVIKPNGQRGTYTTIKFKDGVEVLAVDDEDYAYFAKEFRYALGRVDLEAVGGSLEEDEKPEDGARRELKEELGIEAKEFVELGTVHHTTSVIKSATILFLARRLSFGEKHQDSSENIKTIKLPFAQAVERALDGELTHASTCVLILRAQDYLAKLKGASEAR